MGSERSHHLNATEKKEVRNALALQWNKIAKTISANHVVFGSYEINKGEFMGSERSQKIVVVLAKCGHPVNLAVMVSLGSAFPRYGTKGAMLMRLAKTSKCKVCLDEEEKRADYERRYSSGQLSRDEMEQV